MFKIYKNKDICLTKIKKIIKQKEIISFDIFDTLLLRPYVKPVDLFFHMEKIYDSRGFANERIHAEIRARKNFSNQEDITLNQIYDEIKEQYKYLKNKEIEMEKQVLFSNCEMQEIYNFAIQEGKKIIITSDMYLPKWLLEEILTKNGYTGYYKLYLSSDLMKTKSSSNLYKYIINDLGVNPSNILHIGDNYNSDFKSAKACKIAAINIRKKIDVFFEKNKKAKIFYKNNSENIGCSILLGILCGYKNKNYWENFGFQYAGPAIFSYVKWLNERFSEDKIQNTIFVARDGYTLQKVFEIIKTADVKSHYVYAPRMLNLIFYLQYKDRLENSEAEGYSAVKTIIDFYKNKDDYLKQNTPKIEYITQGIEFIEKNIKLYQDLSNIEKKSYIEYLNNFGFSNTKIAVVDTISGFLSSQKFIEKIMDTKVNGYYWMTWERTLPEKTEHKFCTFQNSCEQKFIDWNLMEFIMTAPEPPIQSVHNGKPVYKKISNDDEIRIGLYPTISREAINFANTIKDIFKEKDVFFDCDLMIDWINTFIDNPTSCDINEFKNIMHAWDSNHECYIHLIRPWFEAKKRKANFLQQIFSVMNDKNHKIIRILGTKISIKRKTK